MSPVCFELWWFLTAYKIKSKFPRVAHRKGPFKTGHWAFQLSLLPPAMATIRFCFGPREITGSLFPHVFPSGWNMDAHPPSFTQMSPLSNGIFSRRLSLNPGPRPRPLGVFPATWKWTALGSLFTILSSPLEEVISESGVFPAHRSSNKYLFGE